MTGNKGSKKKNIFSRIFSSVSKGVKNLVRGAIHENRRRRVTAVTSVIIMALTIGIVPCWGAVTYWDADNAWVKPYVDRYANVLGYPLSGYDDGSFKYKDACTRGEFFRLLAYTVLSSEDNYYTDYQEKGWAWGYYVELDNYYCARNKINNYAGILSDEQERIAEANPVSFMNEKITRKEVAEYTGKVLHIMLKQEFPKTVTKFNDTGKLSDEQTQCLSLLVNNSILSGYPGNMFKPNANIKKGEMVVIMVKIIDKYNLADPYKRPTRTENLPSNYKDFPYIVADNPNEMYEVPFIKVKGEEFISPAGGIFQKYRKNLEFTANQVKMLLEIVNVDYKNIDKEAIKTALKICDREEGVRVDMYIQSLIDQKVVAECTVVPEPSIVYSDGQWGRMRAKVTLTIKECAGDSVKNLFFGDFVAPINISYKKGVTYTFYVDQGLTPFAKGSETLYTFAESMDHMTQGRVKQVSDIEYYFE